MDTSICISNDTGSVHNHPPEGDRNEDDSAYSSESLAGRELVTSVKPPELRPEELYACTIIRSDSPTEFWVRLSGWEEKMARITQRLMQRYHDSGSPGQFGWCEGDYCAVRYPRARDWIRALIIKVREELVEVVHIDHGTSGMAPLRLLKPLPSQISQITWLSIKVEVVHTVPMPEDFQWSKEVVSKIQEFLDLNDRAAIQVSPLLFNVLHSKIFVDQINGGN